MEVIAIVLALCLVTGCSTQLTKQDTGSVIGALAGGALAYSAGKDSSNKGLWTALGIGAGAMMGNQIGAALDQRDRLLLGQATQATLENAPDNAQGSWRNPNSGASGTIRPTATTMSATGTPCREFVQTIYVGGQAKEGYGRACRQADGSWKIQGYQ